MYRRLPRIVFFIAAVSAACALAAPQATAATVGSSLGSPTASFVDPPWWQCPDSGSCSAPVLRLWLPSFGRGHSIVEAGRTIGSCGAGCYEIPNGEVVTIRAVPDPGYRFTGWGGKCQSVRSTGCWFHMWNNYTAGTTFEPDPSAPNAQPGISRDPVTPVLDFVLQISGKGTVAVQGTGLAFPTYVCKTTYPCRVTRFIKRDVQLVAINTSSSQFRGWGGRCRGAQLWCTFKNDFGRDGAPRVVAYFG